MDKSVLLVEEIMLHSFRTVPFHNLYYICEKRGCDLAMGGTCTDKARHFISLLDKMGIQGVMHTAKLKNKYAHRVVMLHSDERIFFADVGNAWPSVKLFPANGEEEYQAYGITFQSKADQYHVAVKHTIGKGGSWPLLIPQKLRRGQEEARQTQCRYDDKLPFSQGVRFAQVLGDQFVFLKDTTVRIYDNNGDIQEHELLPSEIPCYIEEHFLFPLGELKEALTQFLNKKFKTNFL